MYQDQDLPTRAKEKLVAVELKAKFAQGPSLAETAFYQVTQSDSVKIGPSMTPDARNEKEGGRNRRNQGWET